MHSCRIGFIEKCVVKYVTWFRRCRNNEYKNISFCTKFKRYYCTNSEEKMEEVLTMDVLKTVAVKMPLKTGVIDVQYFDTLTCLNDSAAKTQQVRATIITSHGTPGSHNDFKYMVPKLMAFGFRVVSINWPGFGFTECPDEFDHTNVERAQLLTCFVKCLNIEKVDIFIGHSAGCYPLPLFFNENPRLCSAAIFVNPGGCTPHKGIRPYWALQLLSRLLNTFLAPVINYFLYLVTTRIFKMKFNDISQAGVMTRAIANIDFIYLNAVLLSLKQSKTPPILLMCGRKDHLVEVEKSIEYAETLGCHEDNRLFHVESGLELEILKEKIFPLYRHCAVIFAHGTHFLQKIEADAICNMANEILNSKRQ